MLFLCVVVVEFLVSEAAELNEFDLDLLAVLKLRWVLLDYLVLLAVVVQN